MSIMNSDSGHPRRLRVSTLAAVANPSYTRIDTWNLLDDACHHLATCPACGAGHQAESGSGEAAAGSPGRLRTVLAVPGRGESGGLPRLSRRSGNGAPDRRGVAGGAPAVGVWRPRRTVRHGLRRWPTRSLWRGQSSNSSTPFCWPTTLPPRFPKAWRKACGRCVDPSDDVQFELLVVSSVEDAISAVALNGEIQAAIIRHDLPLRSRDRLPLMTTLLGAKEPAGRDGSHGTTGSSAASGSGSCGHTSTCTCSSTNRSRR